MAFQSSARRTRADVASTRNEMDDSIAGDAYHASIVAV